MNSLEVQCEALFEELDAQIVASSAKISTYIQQAKREHLKLRLRHPFTHFEENTPEVQAIFATLNEKVAQDVERYGDMERTVASDVVYEFRMPKDAAITLLQNYRNTCVTQALANVQLPNSYDCDRSVNPHFKTLLEDRFDTHIEEYKNVLVGLEYSGWRKLGRNIGTVHAVVIGSISCVPIFQGNMGATLVVGGISATFALLGYKCSNYSKRKQLQHQADQRLLNDRQAHIQFLTGKVE